MPAATSLGRGHADGESEVRSVLNVIPYHDEDDSVLEPIAVIGFSFEYPQDADSPASFWSMLEERRCAMTEWPQDRINLDAFYHRDEDREERVRQDSEF